MRRIALSLLLWACGDDGTGDTPSSSTGDGSSSTPATSTGVDTTTTGDMTSESSSSSSGVFEGSSTTDTPADVVACVSLPNELAEWMQCDPGAVENYAVLLCVGRGVCEFSNACACVGGEVQVELRTEPETPVIEVRSVGMFTIPDCGEYDPIDAMGGGCTNLPADTALAFTLDDGVGNQVVLEVRKNGTEMGTWSLLSFTPQ